MARAQEILENYRVYRDQRQDHFNEAQRDRDFVVNKQWEEEEANELLARGHAPLVINRIYPVIMQEIAIMTAKPVEFRVTAREDSDVRVAGIGNKLLSYVQDRNNFGLIFDAAMYDFLVPGAAYIMVYQDRYTFEGAEVGLAHVPFDDAYPDPYSRKRDLSDGEAFLISKFITRGQFQRLYPDQIGLLSKVQQEFGNDRPRTSLYNESKVIDPRDIYDPKRELYRIIEVYTVSKVPKVKVTDATGGIKLYTKEAWEKARKIQATVEAISMGALKARDVWDDQAYLEISIGNEMLFGKGALPSRNIPVIPFLNFHNGTPYSLGDVRFLKGLQKEINKRRSLLIAHAATSTAAKLLLEKGAVDNVEEVERKNARPGAVIEYNVGYNKPEQSSPTPFSNGLFQLEAESKYDLEYQAGMFALSQGSSRDAPETFRATLAIEEYGNRRLNQKMKNVTNSLSLLGKTVWEFMQQTYNYDKVVRIVSPDTGDEETIKLGLADNPRDAEIRKIFDITTGIYDVKAVAGSTMASNRWAEMQEYKEILQLGGIDLEEFLKKTDIFDREGILKRRGQIQQLSQQLEQLGQMLEQMQSESSKKDSKIQQLIEQVIKLQIQLQETKKLVNAKGADKE